MFVRDIKLKDAMDEINERVDAITTEQEKRIAELEAKVAVLNDIREKKASDEPWVEVIGGDIDPEKGLQLKLDWNDAFIDQLRAKGFKGTSEGSLVGEYLLQLSQMLAEDDQ